MYFKWPTIKRWSQFKHLVQVCFSAVTNKALGTSGSAHAVAEARFFKCLSETARASLTPLQKKRMYPGESRWDRKTEVLLLWSLEYSYLTHESALCSLKYYCSSHKNTTLQSWLFTDSWVFLNCMGSEYSRTVLIYAQFTNFPPGYVCKRTPYWWISLYFNHYKEFVFFCFFSIFKPQSKSQFQVIILLLYVRLRLLNMTARGHCSRKQTYPFRKQCFLHFLRTSNLTQLCQANTGIYILNINLKL